LQEHLNEGLEEDEIGDDVLGWWKVYSHRNPVVAHMAHDVLVVPTCIVALESAINVG